MCCHCPNVPCRAVPCLFLSLPQAEVASVRSAEPINEWAAKVTNNLIPQVVSPSLNFNMVITNAVYFKGLWEHPFDKARTQKKNFTALTAEGTKVSQIHDAIYKRYRPFKSGHAMYAHTSGCGEKVTRILVDRHTDVLLRATSLLQYVLLVPPTTPPHTPPPLLPPTSPPSPQVVQVPMMTRVMDPAQLQRGAQKVMYAEVPGKYRAVRLPYKGSSGLAAVLVLPDASTYTTVFDAAADITAAAIMDRKGWSRLLDGLVLSLPRFKVSVQQLKLNKVWAGRGCGRGGV